MKNTVLSLNYLDFCNSLILPSSDFICKDIVNKTASVAGKYDK